MPAEPWQYDPTFERVAKILADRGMSPACPLCGENGWIPHGELENLMVTLPSSNATGDPLEGGGLRHTMACYVAACANCGFVRLNSAETVERVKDEPARKPTGK